MTRGIIRGSDLLKSIGWNNDTMEVEYQDGTVFRYFNVPLSTFRAVVRPKKGETHGQAWLRLRDKYRFKEV